MRAYRPDVQGMLYARIREAHLGHGRNSAIVSAEGLHATDRTWRQPRFLRAPLSPPPPAAVPAIAI